MREIVVVIQQGLFEHNIYLMDNNVPLESSVVPASELADKILEMSETSGVTDVAFAGAGQFVLRTERDLLRKEIDKYGHNTLNIKRV